MKNIPLLLTLLLLSIFTKAQNPGFAWIKTVNGTANEQTNDIVFSKDNFIYTCGSFSSASVQLNTQTLSSAGNSDIFIAKYDTSGTLIWAKRYGGTGADNAQSITADSLNNIYITGSCTGAVNFGSLSFAGGSFILKIDGSGNENWIVQPAVNVTINDIAADPSGNTVICGSFTGTATVGTQNVTATVADDGFIARYNSSGAFSWMKQLYSTPPGILSQYAYLIDRCNSVTVAPNGTIGFCGTSQGPEKIILKSATAADTAITSETFDGQQAYGYLCFLIKLDAAGNFIWYRDNMNGPTNSGRYQSMGFDLASSGNNDFYISLDFLSKTLNQGNHNGRLAKYNNAGLLQWAVSSPAYLGPTPWAGITSPKTAFYGGKVYFTEKIPDYSMGGSQDISKTRIHCYNEYGTYQWSTPFNNVSSDITAMAARENVYATGFLSLAPFGNLTATYSGGTDGYLTKAGTYSPPITPIIFSPAIADKTICPGGNINLAPGVVVSGGVQPYTYRWSPSIGLSDSTALNTTASPGITTNYILTIRDARDSVLRDTMQLTVRPAFAKPTITLINGSFANGQQIDTLVCNTPETGLQYTWTNQYGNMGPYVSTNKLGVNNNSGYGIYKVNIKPYPTDQSGCTAVSDSFYYHAFKANAGADQTICAGQSVVLGGNPAYYGNPIGNAVYMWAAIGGSAPGEISNTGIAHPTVSPQTTKDYILTVTDQSGLPLYILPDTVRVNVYPGISTPTINTSGNITFCQGDSVILTSSPAATYLWSTGAVSQSITVKDAGTYSVTVATASGCSAVSAPLTITVNPAAGTPTILPLGPTTFCNESSVMLNASPGIAYQWSTGETTQVITVTNSGNYTVRVTNPYGCISGPSAPVSIVVNPLPATPTISASGPTTFCQGSSVVLSSSPGLTYQWSNAAVSNSVIASFTDTYTVRVGDANGCYSHPSAPVNTTMIPTPATPQITAGGPLVFCQGGNVVLSSSIAATSYIWNNNPSTQQSITVSSTSTNTVKIVQNGCSSAASIPVTVTVNPLPAKPVITAGGPTSFCQGGNVTLSSSAGNSYLWSNGANTAAINVNTTGAYFVSIKDNNNCQSPASDVITVTVNPLPATPVITQSDNILHSNAASGNQWYFNGAPIPGANGVDYTYSIGGDYAVEVTNAFGCKTMSSTLTASRMLTHDLKDGEKFLYQVNANPVNAASVIRFTLRSAARVSVYVMDMFSKPVIQVIKEQQLSVGTYAYPAGNKLMSLPKGMYLIIYMVNGERFTEKISVM